MFRQFILCVVLIAVALGGWIAFVPSARETLERTGLLDLIGIEIAEARDADGGGGFGPRGPTKVVTEPVARAVYDDRISAIGDGRARRSVDVRADASGLVTELGVAAGGYVEAGDLIARLDDEAEAIALERARIVLADAQDQVERVSRLQGTGAITEVRAREAELALRSAELALRQAEVDLAERRIVAPISGWTGILDLERGDRVSAEEVLLTITDRSEILVDFRVPERLVGDVQPGLPFDAVPLARPEVRLSGEISAIDTTIDRASRTLRVQGRLDNSDDTLRGGMAFSIELRLEGETYPAIDPLALQWSSDGSFVWTVADGKAARVPVIIRQRNSDTVLVEADLTAGQLVVIEGVQSLRPGAEVERVGGTDDDEAVAPGADGT